MDDEKEEPQMPPTSRWVTRDAELQDKISESQGEREQRRGH
jgi:hypothetical protein